MIKTSDKDWQIKKTSVYIEDVEYFVTYEEKLIFDPSYGADADGNRGVPQWFVDDMNIVSVLDIDNGKNINIDDDNNKKLIEAIYDLL